MTTQTAHSGPNALGLLCGIGAAVFYTIANICLRQVVEVDPVWVSTIKALPTLVAALPLVALRALRNQSIFPDRSHVKWLVITGVCAQIFGNVTFQWSLSILGLAISVPMILGSMLIGGAIVGRVVLHEPVRHTTVVAIVFLLAGAVLLTRGAQSTVSSQYELTFALVLLAAAGNIAAGIAYAFLGTVMRRSMQAGIPLVSTLLVLSTVGTILLSSWSVCRLGVNLLAVTSQTQFQTMLWAGIFNAVAFFLLAKALQHIPVLMVQILNASQAAMAAAAGWMLFDERLSAYVQAGLGVTAFGLILAGVRPRRSKNDTKDRQL
ncbi:MAG: DMT family transporter [Planctomycetales bacterium]|nr:DMT family transporter [Planctomycetales bacterium]